MNKNTMIAVVLIIVAGIAGFFGGIQYQKAQRASFGQFAGQGGQFRQRFGQNGQNFRPVRGTVISFDDTGLTVKSPDGSSKIVIVSSSTAFMKSDTAAKSDIKTGDTVMVFGAQNSDGSVTAQQVQINPPTRQMTPQPTVTQ